MFIIRSTVQRVQKVFLGERSRYKFIVFALNVKSC